MRAPLILAGSLLLFCSAARAEVAAPIAQCIRENAPKVEETIASLPEATEFLVGSLCLAQVAEEQKRLQNLTMKRYTDAQKKRCADKKAAGQSTKLGAGDESFDPCAMLDVQEDYSQFGEAISIFAPGRAMPDATALAAKTLLDLRLARTKSTGR